MIAILTTHKTLMLRTDGTCRCHGGVPKYACMGAGFLGFMTSTLAQTSRVECRAIWKLRECARVHSLQRNALLRQTISQSSCAQLSAKQCKLAMLASSTQTCRTHIFVCAHPHTRCIPSSDAACGDGDRHRSARRRCEDRMHHSGVSRTQNRDCAERKWSARSTANTTQMLAQQCGNNTCCDANSLTECRMMGNKRLTMHNKWSATIGKERDAR